MRAFVRWPVMEIKTAESQNCHCAGRRGETQPGSAAPLVHAAELLISVYSYSSMTALFNHYLLCCGYVSL